MFFAIGHDNFVNDDKVVAVLKPGSAPMRKLKEQAKAAGKLVDGTAGKPTRSFVLMENGMLIQSVNTPATLISRVTGKRMDGTGNEDCSRSR